MTSMRTKPKRVDDREAKRRHDQMQKRRQQLEASIEGKETERATLATEMNDPNFYIRRKDADELIGRYQQLGREVERLYADLEKLETETAACATPTLNEYPIVSGVKSDYHCPSYLGRDVAKATEKKISDRELVAAMANGDADALRALSARYARMLGALAYRFVKDESDAEEIAADALWQAWREAAIIRSFAQLGQRVAGDARQEPRHRQIQGRTRAPSAGKSAARARAGGRCAIELETAERAKIVKQAVGELDTRERELLELAYFSDLSQTEIANKVGLPLGTVKTRMRTALIKLRDTLRRLR